MGTFLPQLQEVEARRDMLNEFRGYNHNLRIQDSEFFDMKNMTGLFYPVLAPRAPRGRVRKLAKPNGLFAHNKLAWVDETGFYYDGKRIGTVADSPKQIVAMGAYIVIFPDKMYFNTETGELKSLGARKTTSGTVRTTMCKVDGSDIAAATGNTEPQNPTNGQYWIDTSTTPHTLRLYSSITKTWNPVATTYAKIAAAGIGAGFSEYDGITISGMANADLNGEFTLHGAANDYIIITALVEAVATQTAAVTVERTIPDMEFITESENRLWGCNSDKHEIYACKLGDPTNWKSFIGTSVDSYAVTVGTTGNFTGACTHLGYVLFFKEDVIHKIYGNRPSNYQITNVNARGVQSGSDRSVVAVNETLFYKSKHDVCAYGAALPDSVSNALGQVGYHNAAAGACGARYFISMADASGRYSLFVYDTNYGTWHKEDDVQVKHFAQLGSDLYFINEADGYLYSVNGNITDYADGNARLEAGYDWYAETGDIGMESPDQKYISKLTMRVEVDDKALVRIQVKYDRRGDWEEIYRLNVASKRSFSVPFIPRRCDTMRLRFWGEGDFRLYSITKTTEQGSDV
ncbi:MAG TPA: hypothetical protein DEB31_05485 [Clostridiales bacterium]|nr:hypothetical protein [Clostridiales bacterium]